MKLGIEPINSSEEWNKSLLDSKHNTFYMNGDLLKKLSPDIKFYHITNGFEKVAALPLYEGINHLPHIYYYGLALKDEFYKSSQLNQMENLSKIFLFLCKNLYLNYKNICFSLNSDFIDIRGFLWANHDLPKLKLTVMTKYTHCIDIEGNSYENLFESFRSVRKQEVRYAVEREKLKTTYNNDISDLIFLYKEVFKRQGTLINEFDLLAINIFFNELKKSILNFDIIEIINNNNKTVASALIFIDYNNILHIPVVGTGDSNYGGTLLYSSILKWGVKHKVKTIDFNGSNSPKRAFFKQSFGGRSQLFFQIVKSM